MPNSRFPWSRVPLDAQVDQLQKHGFRRYIAKDSPLAQLAKIRQEIYNEGYNAGIKAALAQLQGLTDEHSPRIN